MAAKPTQPTPPCESTRWHFECADAMVPDVLASAICSGLVASGELQPGNALPVPIETRDPDDAGDRVPALVLMDVASALGAGTTPSHGVAWMVLTRYSPASRALSSAEMDDFSAMVRGVSTSGAARPAGGARSAACPLRLWRRHVTKSGCYAEFVTSEAWHAVPQKAERTVDVPPSIARVVLACAMVPPGDTDAVHRAMQFLGATLSPVGSPCPPPVPNPEASGWDAVSEAALERRASLAAAVTAPRGVIGTSTGTGAGFGGWGAKAGRAARRAALLGELAGTVKSPASVPLSATRARVDFGKGYAGARPLRASGSKGLRGSRLRSSAPFSFGGPGSRRNRRGKTEPSSASSSGGGEAEAAVVVVPPTPPFMFPKRVVVPPAPSPVPAQEPASMEAIAASPPAKAKVHTSDDFVVGTISLAEVVDPGYLCLRVRVTGPEGRADVGRALQVCVPVRETRVMRILMCARDGKPLPGNPTGEDMLRTFAPGECVHDACAHYGVSPPTAELQTAWPSWGCGVGANVATETVACIAVYSASLAAESVARAALDSSLSPLAIAAVADRPGGTSVGEILMHGGHGGLAASVHTGCEVALRLEGLELSPESTGSREHQRAVVLTMDELAKRATFSPLPLPGVEGGTAVADAEAERQGLDVGGGVGGVGSMEAADDQARDAKASAARNLAVERLRAVYMTADVEPGAGARGGVVAKRACAVRLSVSEAGVVARTYVFCVDGAAPSVGGALSPEAWASKMAEAACARAKGCSGRILGQSVVVRCVAPEWDHGMGAIDAMLAACVEDLADGDPDVLVVVRSKPKKRFGGSSQLSPAELGANVIFARAKARDDSRWRGDRPAMGRGAATGEAADATALRWLLHLHHSRAGETADLAGGVLVTRDAVASVRAAPHASPESASRHSATVPKPSSWGVLGREVVFAPTEPSAWGEALAATVPSAGGMLSCASTISALHGPGVAATGETLVGAAYRVALVGVVVGSLLRDALWCASVVGCPLPPAAATPAWTTRITAAGMRKETVARTVEGLRREGSAFARTVWVEPGLRAGLPVKAVTAPAAAEAAPGGASAASWKGTQSKGGRSRGRGRGHRGRRGASRARWGGIFRGRGGGNDGDSASEEDGDEGGGTSSEASADGGEWDSVGDELVDEYGGEGAPRAFGKKWARVDGQESFSASRSRSLGGWNGSNDESGDGNGNGDWEGCDEAGSRVEGGGAKAKAAWNTLPWCVRAGGVVHDVEAKVALAASRASGGASGGPINADTRYAFSWTEEWGEEEPLAKRPKLVGGAGDDDDGDSARSAWALSPLMGPLDVAKAVSKALANKGQLAVGSLAGRLDLVLHDGRKGVTTTPLPKRRAGVRPETFPLPVGVEKAKAEQKLFVAVDLGDAFATGAVRDNLGAETIAVVYAEDERTGERVYVGGHTEESVGDASVTRVAMACSSAGGGGGNLAGSDGRKDPTRIVGVVVCPAAVRRATLASYLEGLMRTRATMRTLVAKIGGKGGDARLARALEKRVKLMLVSAIGASRQSFLSTLCGGTSGGGGGGEDAWVRGAGESAFFAPHGNLAGDMAMACAPRMLEETMSRAGVTRGTPSSRVRVGEVLRRAGVVAASVARTVIDGAELVLLLKPLAKRVEASRTIEEHVKGLLRPEGYRLKAVCMRAFLLDARRNTSIAFFDVASGAAPELLPRAGQSDCFFVRWMAAVIVRGKLVAREAAAFVAACLRAIDAGWVPQGELAAPAADVKTTSTSKLYTHVRKSLDVPGALPRQVAVQEGILLGATPCRAHYRRAVAERFPFWGHADEVAKTTGVASAGLKGMDRFVGVGAGRTFVGTAVAGGHVEARRAERGVAYPARALGVAERTDEMLGMLFTWAAPWTVDREPGCVCVPMVFGRSVAGGDDDGRSNRRSLPTVGGGTGGGCRSCPAHGVEVDPRVGYANALEARLVLPGTGLSACTRDIPVLVGV